MVVGDGDLLLDSRPFVFSGDLENAVDVDLEGHFDLGDASGGGGDSVQVELSEEVVVFGHGSLAFVYLLASFEWVILKVVSKVVMIDHLSMCV